MTIALPLAIGPDHPAFAGHFPSRPVVPGVVLLDLCIRSIAARHGHAVRWSVDSAKFLSPVVPGDALTLAFDDAVNARGRVALSVTATNGGVGRVAMTASLSRPVAH